VTVNGEDAPVAVKQPGVDVTKYPVTPEGNLPVQAGAVNVTDAHLFEPAVAVPIVGAPGGAGHVLAPRACICCFVVQVPEKLGITSFLYS
jgi:hypothetical protein